MSATAWEHHRDRIADTIRHWRRRHPDVFDHDRILIDRIAASLDSLDALLEPTAADLVQAGYDVDRALENVDRHVEALNRRMGAGARP